MIHYLSGNEEYEGKMSRYSVLRLIEDNKEIYLETANLARIPVTDVDNYHVVKEKEVNRLDLISNLYYGTPNYWWMIAQANNLIDPLVVNKGTMLRIPSMMTMLDSRTGVLVR